MGEYVKEQFERIDAILGDRQEQGFSAAVEAFFEYLCRALVLPCEVKGIEDLQWEEYYIIGPGSRKEHERLRKTQPSYLDRYELVKIELPAHSKWMMHSGEDVGARVKRKSDKKEFVLGLSELEAVDKSSPNYRLLDDYSVFFANAR